MGPARSGATTKTKTKTKETTMKKSTTLLSTAAAAGALALGAAGVLGQSATAASSAVLPDASFTMPRSATALATGCLPNAKATVKITKLGNVEEMVVSAKGLVPNTEYDLFVIQAANAPFGLSWYQGDMSTNAWGVARGTFLGRFSEETFTVAPGTTAAPVVHDSPIRDASSNPATAPVHQYHLGLWFNDPAAAAAAGCGGAVTPFNGDHNAGVQILSTRQFPALNGPLHKVLS
jgi:hypothetical protein